MGTVHAEASNAKIESRAEAIKNDEVVNPGECQGVQRETDREKEGSDQGTAP